jgi:hypothetical protein
MILLARRKGRSWATQLIACNRLPKARSGSIKPIALALVGAMTLGLTSSILAGDPRIDVSQIVSKADAESILDEKVRDPTPQNVEGKDGYYSKCNYYGVSRGKSLVVRVHQPTAGAIDPQKELELVAASSGPMKPIDGLGDKAQVFSETGDNGVVSRVFMLYVAKGNSFIAIGLGGISDESIALEKARSVAQKLIEHL